MNDVLFHGERLFDAEEEQAESSGTCIEYDGEYRATTDVVSIYEMRGRQDKGAQIMAELLEAIRGAIVEVHRTQDIARNYQRARAEEVSSDKCDSER